MTESPKLSVGAMLALFGVACALGLIWLGGIDLIVTRAGFGMLCLGVAGILALPIVWRSKVRISAGLASLVAIGGVYFIARAAIGGPLGLAVPDIALVIVFLGSYFLSSVFSQGRSWIFLAVLALVVTINVGVGFHQSFSENPSYIFRSAPHPGGVATGFFGHRNPFAGFVNGTLFFFLSFCVIARLSRWWRLACGGLVVAMLGIIFLSESRGGWLAFIMGLGVWFLFLCFFLKKIRSPKLPLVAIVGTVLMVTGLATSIWMVKAIEQSRSEEESSEPKVEKAEKVEDGGRLGLQRIAFEIFLKEPLVGSGARAFSYYSIEEWDLDLRGLHQGNPEFAHNEYAQTAADYGLIGLCLVLLGIFGHGVSGGMKFFEALDASDRSSAALKLGALGGGVAILTQCFFSFLLHTPSLMCLLAVQLGILASGPSVPKPKADHLGKLLGVGTRGVILVLLVVMGSIFASSYLQRDKAKGLMFQVRTQQDAEVVLDMMISAATKGRDVEMMETAGHLAYDYGREASQNGQSKVAERFFLKSVEIFQRVKQLNPHSLVAVCGLPRVLDALGRYDEAEEAHQVALQKAWSRERFLKPHYFAARNAVIHAHIAYTKGEKALAERRFREAGALLDKRHELFYRPMWTQDIQDFDQIVRAWLAYLEGERLYREGDRLWKKRQVERGYALMLAAAKRYEISEEVVSKHDPNWRPQWMQLQQNLEILKSARIVPEPIPEEEIMRMATALETSDEKR